MCESDARRVTIQQIENIMLFGIIRDGTTAVRIINYVRWLLCAMTHNVIRMMLCKLEFCRSQGAPHVPLPIATMIAILSTKH